MLTQDVDDDVVGLIQQVPVHDVVLILLAEDLAEALLTNFIDGEMPELIHRLLPIVPRSGIRLHLIDPSREVNMKTLCPHVATILRGRTDGVEDAGEMPGWMFVGLEGLLVSIPCCRVRETNIEILFAGDLVFVERLEVGM